MNKEPAVREVRCLEARDFELAFGESLSSYVVDRINEYSFLYSEFSQGEIEELYIRIIDALLDPDLMKSGEHRLDQWELGWGENLELFLKDPRNVEHIVPKYFNKYGAVRWRGKLIQPVSEKFEYHSLAIILDWIFDKYMRQSSAVYEFGCGTGHNLLGVRRVNKHATLWGLDWASASQKIIKRMSEVGVDQDINSHQFDYFNPDYSFELLDNSTVYTVASLEQVGANWDKFVQYLLDKKPKICVHIEPIGELLSSSKLIDNLSIKYFKKRNYLDGFLDGLRKLEARGRLKIHEAQRTNIGSLFIEGYSVVVWSPIK